MSASPSALRILITGAAGFIGGALGRRLTRLGHFAEGIDLPGSDDPGFPCVRGDVRDAAALDRLCEERGFDAIVHAGGVSGRSIAREHPADVLAVNVMGTVNVFETARRLGVSRVILCSSGSVYGRTVLDPVTEDAPTIPLNAYGASKVASESILHAYAELGVQGTALRIFQAYGPGRRTRCTLGALIEAGLTGKVAETSYRADAAFQFVNIDDVVEALISAVCAPSLPRRIYNIAGGTSLSLDQVTSVVREVLPGLRVRYGDDPLSREYGLADIDLAAAKQDLAFWPRIGLRDGIARFADHLERQQETHITVYVSPPSSSAVGPDMPNS